MSPGEQLPPTAPIDIVSNRGMRDTFAALAVPNYRRYAIAQFLGNTAGWAQRIAIDWLVLELTGNVALVGLTIAVQFGPAVLFGAYGGVIADRLPRRTVVMVGQSVVAVLSGILAALVLTGDVSLWLVYGVVLGIGIAQAFEGPARSALVGELTGTGRLRSAVGLGASLFHLGALVGPAIAAILIVAVGAGWCIAINSVAIAIGILLLATLRADQLHRVPPAPRQRGQIRDALRYVARKPAVKSTMAGIFVVALFGSGLPALLAGFVRDTGTGADGFGLANSLVAVGSLAGALAAVRSRSLRVRTVIFAVLGYGVVLTATGLAPMAWLVFVLLVPLGFARVQAVILAESLVQLSINPGIRGRVLSLWALVMLGGQAAGGPLVGGLAQWLGAQTAMALCGAVVLGTTLVLAVALARTGGLTLRLAPAEGRLLRRRPMIVPVPPKSLGQGLGDTP